MKYVGKCYYNPCRFFVASKDVQIISTSRLTTMSLPDGICKKTLIYCVSQCSSPVTGTGRRGVLTFGQRLFFLVQKTFRALFFTAKILFRVCFLYYFVIKYYRRHKSISVCDCTTDRSMIICI